MSISVKENSAVFVTIFSAENFLVLADSKTYGNIFIAGSQINLEMLQNG
jgi:hypothetical protein